MGNKSKKKNQKEKTDQNKKKKADTSPAVKAKSKKTKPVKSNSKLKSLKFGDQQVPVAQGGETHQSVVDGVTLTTQQGVPISDDQNTLRTGPRGPALLEDFHFREKLFHFDHERIPERVVHARGFGAHGYFENYENLSKYTAADIFQRPNEKTPAFVRFSTVAGNMGSPDLARDVRGFAVKLYTKQGNWDIVGNNIPVFFIQDAMKFPDLVHAAKQEPDRGFPQAQTAHDNFWDFISLSPEAMNMVMWIMSDRTIPRSLRFMEGFGVHTFRMITEDGKSTFVKFHWKPKLGMQSVVWNEAVKINGADPDFHRRDMWNAIKKGEFPEWELGLQLFDQKFADNFDFDILDPTKLIPEELVPVKPVGKLVLNRCVDNFFAETEQVAFCTQNIVPGIDFTNDPLLQGRNFSYLDTQIKRLGGPNFTQIPINAPKTAVQNFQQDGHMTIHYRKGRANYEPNSWEGEERGPREDAAKGFKSFREVIEGTKARLRSESFADHYSQARQFYLSQTEVEQDHIANALVFELSKVETEAIRNRMVSHLLNIEQTLAETVASGLGISSLPKPAEAAKPTKKDLKISDALSILKNTKNTFKGRKLGVLASNGASETLLGKLKKLSEKEGFDSALIAKSISGIESDKGNGYAANEQIGGGPSVLFDAVALMVTKDNIEAFSKEPGVRDFVSDALAHKKFIACTPDSVPLIEMAGATSESPGVVLIEKESDWKSFIEKCGELRCWDR